MPYGVHSIIVGLETPGFGFFLGLAFLFAALIFQGGGLERALFWVFMLTCALLTG